MALTLVAFCYLCVSVLYRWTRDPGFGEDSQHYFDGALRFLETGSPYLPWQIAGPFDFSQMPFLHPPVALYLFVPFAHLPRIVWWAVPLVGTAALVVSMRPARWSWPIILGLLCWPTLAVAVIWGNSDIWVLFAVAAGLRFGWPSLAVIGKPSMFPMMFTGIRQRSWWLGITIVGLLCLPFGGLWVDWIAVVVNSPGTWTYSLASMVPMLSIVVAHAARTRQAGHPDGSRLDAGRVRMLVTSLVPARIGTTDSR